MNGDIIDLELYEPDGSHSVYILFCKCKPNDTPSDLRVEKIIKPDEVSSDL